MDLMWLFTVPVLKLAIKIAVGLSASFLFIQVIRWFMQSRPKNPFAEDSRQPRKPYVHDPKKRDEVIAQSFSRSKVPDGLDAIVIGSGIGGLSTAVIMAKAGKRVLVLEQHDQAGGCCHSFIDKGFEFDVGIHYIGNMEPSNLGKTFLDQITQGQLEWEPLDKEYDVVSIGYGEKNRKYPVPAGPRVWKEQLKERFPEEHAAIDQFFVWIYECKGSTYFYTLFKLLPLWLVRLLVLTRLERIISSFFFTQVANRRTAELVNGLTQNKDLRTIMTYSWGDFGTPPSHSHFGMQALLHKHFLGSGAYYPIGGASEIAHSIIPVIEAAGGQVLVRANVTAMLQRGGKVCGVSVKKGSETMDIFAPMIISSAGVYNTFAKLLPKELAQKSYFSQLIKELKPGWGGMSVFLGLDISNKELEELNVKKQNLWAFSEADSDEAALKYMALSREEALTATVPLLFVSFPSLKDPLWANHPGREGKSTCALVTLANWEWFKDWEEKGVKKRGDDYEEVKNAIGSQMVEQACTLLPQIRDKIVYTEIGSPATNNYYIASAHGEIYGLDHSIDRFQTLTMAKLRPETDIPGLYLTGQDILTCGFMGGLFSGALTAQVCLGRNVFYDLGKLHAQLQKGGGKKTKKD